MQTSTTDGNPRPLKRQRVDTMSISTEGNALDAQNLTAIPPANLLLVLPSLLLHPPTHPRHQLSLELASAAVKKLLNLPDLDGAMECRAWTALAELGIVHRLPEPTVVNEIEKAVAKALLLAQKHPSLRFYKPHLSFLSARIAHEYQNNSKYAIHTVRRLLNSLEPSDPPQLLYAAHLAMITYSENESTSRLLDTIQNFQSQAANNGHNSVKRLAQIIRLRVLLKEGLFQDVGPALKEAEDSFQMNSSNEGLPSETEEHAADLCLRLHLLIMGVVYYTYAGDVSSTASRLTKLHELLDKGSIDQLGTTGIIEFPLPESQPLYVQMSHPRVLYLLAFLVSSVSKRNPVGRKPKRKVFAAEGLAITERELQKEIALPMWASQHDAIDVYGRMHKMKADMLSELVGHSICRSEFDEAERYLNTLIAHTRSTSLFPMYAARITLHHAHLAHSLGQTERALDCYRVAANLSQPRAEQDGQSNDLEDACSRTPRTPRKRTASPTKKSGASPLRSPSLSPRKRSVSPKKKRQLRSLDVDQEEQYSEDTWVYTSARAGDIWLRIGLARQRARAEDQVQEANTEIEELAAEGEAIAQECDGLGGTLKAVGEVIRSCLTGEILRSKGHLRTALELTSAAQDNHLRALVVGLISSHYLHTSRDHAENMLLTCEQLAAGLGAQPRPQKTNNTPSKLPLSSSDKVNIDRKGSDRCIESVDASIKPGSKRKINEVDDMENCAPSPKQLRKADDSLPWGGDDVGNAQLRLWVGERCLDLCRWAKDERKVKMQEDKIRKLQEAVNHVEKRAKLKSVC